MRRAEHSAEDQIATVIDDTPPDWRRKANWARLIQKVYEVDLLECPNCGNAMCIIALIDDNAVIDGDGHILEVFLLFTDRDRHLLQCLR